MENKKEFFAILNVSRDDFNAVGYDASNLTNNEMEHIASKLGDCLMEGGSYWEYLRCYAEKNDLPLLHFQDIEKIAIRILTNIFNNDDAEDVANELIEEIYDDIKYSANFDNFTDDDVSLAVQRVLKNKLIR